MCRDSPTRFGRKAASKMSEIWRIGRDRRSTVFHKWCFPRQKLMLRHLGATFGRKKIWAQIWAHIWAQKKFGRSFGRSLGSSFGRRWSDSFGRSLGRRHLLGDDTVCNSLGRNFWAQLWAPMLEILGAHNWEEIGRGHLGRPWGRRLGGGMGTDAAAERLVGRSDGETFQVLGSSISIEYPGCSGRTY